MAVEFHWARLEALSAPALHEILLHRERVFVVEQACAYQDADEHDAHAWHLSGRIDGHFALYLRVVDPGHKYPEPSIGRVLTALPFRGQGLGRVLLAEAVAGTLQRHPGQGIRISAQAHLRGFYGSFGFVPVGEGYLEDGIPHLEMLRSA